MTKDIDKSFRLNPDMIDWDGGKKKAYAFFTSQAIADSNCLVVIADNYDLALEIGIQVAAGAEARITMGFPIGGRKDFAKFEEPCSVLQVIKEIPDPGSMN